MTQPPPPPPNQPPQGGGFGPPQNQPPQPPQTGGPDLGKAPQPQPGYGYPQAPQNQPPAAPPQPPPAQPGYGYPQGPPQTPPPGTPGYGQPGAYGQQPGGYGHPTPPYGQQPGYGYPQQPTMPMQPQPGGGRKTNAQLAIIVAAVVAIALIVGGGVWYASGKDDGKKDDTANSSGGTGGTDPKGGSGTGGSGGGKEKAPSDPSSKVLFQVPAPEVKNDSSVVVSGSWATDKVYAKSGVAEIVGYDPVKGTKQWTIDLPGPVCQASRHITEDNRTAVTFQPAMPTKADPSHGCSQVAAIDLDAGKKLWTKTLKTGDQLVNFDNVTLSGSTVAVGGTSGGGAFDIASGKTLWSPKPTDSCYDAGYGGGEKLVALRKCGSYDNRQLHIQTIDPKSGKVISEYKMAAGIEYASIVSTEPLVVASDVGDSAGDGSGISDFFSIDNKTGKLRARISAPGEQFAAKCDGISRIDHCLMLAVGNDRLYIPTEEHDSSGGNYSRTNEIVAFDLATGKQTGQRADAGDGYTITPLRMDGGNLLAYKRPPYDKGGQVVSIDGGSFKQTVLLENPATESVRDVETSLLPEYAELLFSQGRFYMSAVYASERRPSSDEKEYLVIAFGTD
ncbi:PQQ-binding-like beta-propeller repeat protein [Streptomyces sp. DH24]|uniref:outer membrane protein assembly factor BamB family protein n=1 Tax=Streptomyces sp. DH24 TaxID=3040123 RepID=UPI002442CA78|nr:PQQ-binding-like beta-propeller repeat protein [Streptomyces sp. DH24]MDG9719407.1 PQQ-binding-like beta-propeller repeat protein [Streptomyces sp. DH24]